MTRPRGGTARWFAALAALLLVLLPQPAAASPQGVQAQEWWTGRLDLPHAWQVGTGRGVTVAMLDSGADPTRGDLHGALLPGLGPDSGQHDFDTAHEHGTNMATLVAGRGTDPGMKGVAPSASILPVVVDSTDKALGIAAALKALLALPHRPQVVNMSVGFPGPCSPDEQAAVKQAVDAGMILVAATGDDGSTTNFPNHPADCAGVVAVGAVDADGQRWPDSNHQSYVALAGPGVDIPSFPGTGRPAENSSGTSAASAIVSGVMALLVQHFPHLTSRQIVARALATARQFQGTPGSRNAWTGFGVVRAYHALTDAVPPDAPNPVYDALAKVTGPAAPSSPAPDTPHTSAPGSSSAPSSAAGASASSGSGSTPIVIGVVVAAVLVAAVLLAVMLRRRRTP